MIVEVNECKYLLKMGIFKLKRNYWCPVKIVSGGSLKRANVHNRW